MSGWFWNVGCRPIFGPSVGCWVEKIGNVGYRKIPLYGTYLFRDISLTMGAGGLMFSRLPFGQYGLCFGFLASGPLPLCSHKEQVTFSGSFLGVPSHLQWIQLLCGVSFRQISQEWLVGSTRGLQHWVHNWKIDNFIFLHLMTSWWPSASIFKKFSTWPLL